MLIFTFVYRSKKSHKCNLTKSSEGPWCSAIPCIHHIHQPPCPQPERGRGFGRSRVGGPHSQFSCLGELSFTPWVSRLSRKRTTPPTILGTQTGFPATEVVMNQFRKLMVVVLTSGVLAGLVLFVVQHFTVIPLIEAAESYETSAEQAPPAVAHEHEGWQPANGWQRTSLTALATVLSGIGFAAMLFGCMALTRKTINTRGRRALGTGRICLLQSGSRPRIAAEASWHQRCRLVRTSALVGWHSDRDRHWIMVDCGSRAKLVAPNRRSGLPVAAALDWCANRYRTEYHSSPTDPPVHDRIRRDHWHVLAPGWDDGRIHLQP